MSPAERVEEFLAAKADALVRRSAEDLGALIGPEFVYVNASGRTFDKAGYIDFYCTSGKIAFSEQAVTDLDVRMFQGFAVATMVLHDKMLAHGKAVAATYRSLSVFSVAGGQWLWVAGQTMPAGST
ncbi:MAG: nuclear transport factor 2 family protein [Proteobacteria bacterium]|nr:nuclear transport factor 2 family protein [Pseudomonadota bacterium]